MKNKLILGIITTSLLTAGLAFADANIVEQGNPQQQAVGGELKQDRQTVQSDKQAVRSDREKLRNDTKQYGKDSQQANADRAQLKGDREKIQVDRQKLQSDRKIARRHEHRTHSRKQNPTPPASVN